MELTVGGWKFRVNTEETASYSKAVWKDHCTCGYCRNFYATILEAYPKLQLFLSQFGMDALTPEELMPIEPNLCIASYCISGTVLHNGNGPIDIGGITFTVTTQEQADYDTACKIPYFVLTTGFLDLPWVLEEDMNEVVSPANEPEYLQRMANKLLGDIAPEEIFS